MVYGAEFPVAEPTLAVFWRWRGRERGRETAMSKFNKRVHKTQTGRDREGGGRQTDTPLPDRRTGRHAVRQIERQVLDR